MSSVNNRTNGDAWSWGAVGVWKTVVQSFNKKVLVTQAGAVQTAARYWEVAYDIDYREDGWHVRPWDMGFSERCDASGTPTGSGTNRRTILGVDGKPVRQPVALSGGVALPPGTPPVALDFDPYTSVNYTSFYGVPS